MAQLSFNVPNTRDYVNTVKFLVWNQFPAILERSIRYFATLPQVGIYKRTNPNVVDFKRALLENTSRQFTISGIGSLINFDQYGHEIKKPTPNYYGTGCSGNSLCLEPTCFGFTEGVIENNNMLQNMCWSLAMPCLKDQLYSDMLFDQKIQRYFEMFFAQPAGVLQAFQRTHLLRESIKIVATSRNYNYTGGVLGDGLSLPFYINPNEPTAFPDLDVITGGIGGANLNAFARFLAPRLFDGAFSGGMESVDIYGLPIDWEVARDQTMSVNDSPSDSERIESRLDRLMGRGLTADPLFPTFTTDGNNVVYPITAEVLQASTIAGFQQTTNPEHALADIRGLLFVPQNWRYNLVQPPEDDFSYLGIGPGLNFHDNTPGVFPVPLQSGAYLSSSMFRNATMDGGTVILGGASANGLPMMRANGMRMRDRPLSEAVRTRILMTYAQQTCGTGARPVGPAAVTQAEADGFDLKSTMYIGTDVQGTARPVLLLFKTDTPRSALPIEVCNTVDVELVTTGALSLFGCCAIPGGQAALTFTADGATSAELTELVADTYTDGDTAVYRSGPKGTSFLVEITAVSGPIVTIQALDAEGDPDTDVDLLCCSGVPDDYGVLGELLVITGATDVCSEIFKAECDVDSGELSIEVYNPLTGGDAAAEATITLASGTVILVQLVSAADPGVYYTLEAAPGETCVLCELDCGCLLGAEFCITSET